MQNSKQIIIRAALAVWLALPVAAQAQSSSLNAFSPYTFYGLGDFSTQGPAYMRSMGGVGVGYRNSMKINYINPASYSLLGRKTFLFNVGIEGKKTAEAKTSHNSFNVRDIALAMPLGRGVGLGVSVTPLSSVGYRVQMEDTDPLLLANDKYVVYNYLGEGTVTQAKLGLGVQVTKHLALGADLIYYHGRTTRSFSTTVTSLMTSTQYSNAVGRSSETISRIGMNFGLHPPQRQADSHLRRDIPSQTEPEARKRAYRIHFGHRVRYGQLFQRKAVVQPAGHVARGTVLSDA